jgi:hypothetical protein
VGGEHGLAHALALAYGLEEAVPVLVVVDQHAQMAVAGAVGLAMARQQPRIAGIAQRRLEAQPGHVIAQDELRHGLEHGHDHRLALAALLARIQRSRDRIDRMQARDPVAQRHGRIGRLAAAVLLGQPGHAGRPLDQVVVGRLGRIGAGLIEAAAAHMDQARMALLQRLPVQAQSGHGLGPHIADEDIGIGQQLQQRLARCGLLEIQHHGALALVGLQKNGAHAGVAHGAYMAHVVALGRLHLDHIGTQGGQNLRGKRPHDHRGHVHDPDAGQGTG